MDLDNKYTKNNVRKKDNVIEKQSLGFSGHMISVINGGYSDCTKSISAVRLNGGTPRNKKFF